MLLRAPGSTRTDRLFPYTTRVRSGVGDQQGEALAFGLEQLGVRLAAACGQAPVDVARVVSVRVLARLRILHPAPAQRRRSEEHTSELQSLMRISYAVFCLKKKTKEPLRNSFNKSPP